MWYFRKLGWFVGVAFGVSAVIAHWYHTSIESHASSPLGQTLLQLAIAAVFGLLFLEVNIRLIYWFGADEFNQRIEAQWKERILAHAENRRYHAKWNDFLDFVASWDIWGTKIIYWLHLRNWHNEE